MMRMYFVACFHSYTGD